MCIHIVDQINWISFAGIILNFVGVLLIFFVGLPHAIEKFNPMVKIYTGNIDSPKSEKDRKLEKTKAQKEKWAKFGFYCLVVGILLQALGTCFYFG